MVIETQYLTKVLHIYIFLHNSTILNLALVNGRCPSGGPLFRSIGWSCGMNWKWCIQQERNKLLGPREGVTPPPMPRVKTGVREEVCHSSATPPFLSLLSLLPHCRVFSLFTRGLLAPVPRPLTPLPAPPAGHNDDEEEDHSSDASSNSQRQQEKVRERS